MQPRYETRVFPNESICAAPFIKPSNTDFEQLATILKADLVAVETTDEICAQRFAIRNSGELGHDPEARPPQSPDVNNSISESDFNGKANLRVGQLPKSIGLRNWVKKLKSVPTSRIHCCENTVNVENIEEEEEEDDDEYLRE